jgi:hypothetical protein
MLLTAKNEKDTTGWQKMLTGRPFPSSIGRLATYRPFHCPTTTPQYCNRPKQSKKVNLPTAKKRGRYSRLAKNTSWSSLSKARWDIHQSFKVLTHSQEAIAQR